MARVNQTVSKTWHRVQIALVSQPKDLDRKLRLTFDVPASRTRFCTSLSNQLNPAAASPPSSRCRIPDRLRLRSDDKTQIFLPPCIARMKRQRAGDDNSGEQEKRDRVLHPRPG